MAAPARTARPKAAAPGERLELDLYGEINAWSVRDLIATLRANPNADVTLRINSPGGDVIEGFALANVLQGHAGKKVAIVEGACCSAATFIACACEVRMYPESFLMVHGPSADTWGGVEDMESAAALLSKMRDLMTNMYTRKTGADEATVRAWLERDEWMKPDEALAAGFCDEILTLPLPPSARARTARYVAILKPSIRPPTAAKNMRNNMEEKLRDKLAKHGLAEDGGNMEEAYSAYMAETEDGPAERKEMARAMEEMKEASAKAEDDEDKDEESSTGDGAKARVRADAHADPAVAKLIDSLTGQVNKMSKQVERYEAAERKRAEAEFFATAEMHTSRKEAEEYVALCDGDLGKALKLVQKLPRKADALSRWYAGGSPIGGSSNAAADSYEATKTIRQGSTVVNLHGFGLRALAQKIQKERKCSLEAAYKAAARERPDLARASA